MSKLAPSLLSADFSKLGEQAELVSKNGADYIHVDVMDGHFVPNITFGALVMKSLNKCDTAPYDVHLMITDPDKYAPGFVTEKTEYITAHQEPCRQKRSAIRCASYDRGSGCISGGIRHAPDGIYHGPSGNLHTSSQNDSGNTRTRCKSRCIHKPGYADKRNRKRIVRCGSGFGDVG